MNATPQSMKSSNPDTVLVPVGEDNQMCVTYTNTSGFGIHMTCDQLYAHGHTLKTSNEYLTNLAYSLEQLIDAAPTSGICLPPVPTTPVYDQVPQQKYDATAARAEQVAKQEELTRQEEHSHRLAQEADLARYQQSQNPLMGDTTPAQAIPPAPEVIKLGTDDIAAGLLSEPKIIDHDDGLVKFNARKPKDAEPLMEDNQRPIDQVIQEKVEQEKAKLVGQVEEDIEKELTTDRIPVPENKEEPSQTHPGAECNICNKTFTDPDEFDNHKCMADENSDSVISGTLSPSGIRGERAKDIIIAGIDGPNEELADTPELEEDESEQLPQTDEKPSLAEAAINKGRKPAPYLPNSPHTGDITN